MADFIWYELMTPDPDAASRFYGDVIGWTVGPKMAGSDMDYRMIGRSDGGNAGGMLGLSAEMIKGGAHPLWIPYLHADNVDAKVAAIVDEGGAEQMPATTLPVGRIAMVKDPQGVPIYLMTPIPPPGMENMESDVFSVTEPQRVRWNELASPDQQASMDFYARHFGFEFNNAMPMGELGDYCFIDHDARTLGAIMRRQDESQPAVWMMYFGVPSVAAAKRAIEAGGGTVLMGPHEVPGGDWIVVATDPQGAGFGVVGPQGE